MTTDDGVRAGRRVLVGVGEGVAAAFVALVVASVGLFAFSAVQWPAFNSSNVTRALTTVGQVVSVALLVVSVVLIRARKWPWGAKLLSWVGISSFVTVTLGMPLAATKLYLFGVSVDQEFRTEYLTRLTDSAALRDMTYVDLPPFYPAGWFWIGGRVGNVLGMDGWEVFKPYAIGLLAVAAAVALVLWMQLVRADMAVGAAAAVTAMTLAYASPEAYGAVLIVFIPPVLVLAWGALHRRSGGWGAVLGTGVFLGVAACFYTLYLAIAAFTVVIMAVVAAGLAVQAQRVDGRRAWRAGVTPLVKLVVIGGIAIVLALVVWTPYLLKMLSGAKMPSGNAFHYLPESGAQLAFPMLEFSLRGALCIIGVLWLVVRAGSSRRAQALGIGVISIYLWTLLSMAATAAGTTLLSFRLEPVLLALLAAAGVFGFVEGATAIYQALNEPAPMRTAAAAIAILGALAFAQTIPTVLTHEIDTAYTDTDGNGERADQRQPSAVTHYREIDAALQSQTGRPRDESVVLTADTSFLAFYPYWGFQALTSHYANPLSDFKARAETIAAWSKLPNSPALVEALTKSPWRSPDAFLFRTEGDNYTLRLAEDVYPNDPNVKRYTVTFPKSLFTDPTFTPTPIGPFTLITVRR
ncbi:galactan 5-O-arabinofuranosyltransferase [Nocardia sp. NPDC058640]|uniref:galactan 5-O-arabinofuranosyltransferase n=1 Tax=Nocardia sp. NPDC058640 TaxID=3346571 RepID=UPI0036651E16